jgi:hypothetical protein
VLQRNIIEHEIGTSPSLALCDNTLSPLGYAVERDRVLNDRAVAGCAVTTTRPASLKPIGASEVEHRGLEHVSLLLQFLAARLASEAERLADGIEIAEGDGGVLADGGTLRGSKRLDRLAFPAGRARCGRGGRQPERAGRRSPNECHAVGKRVVVDAQPVATGSDRLLKLLVTAREGGFEVGGRAQLLRDLCQRALVGADVFGQAVLGWRAQA